MDPEEIKIRVTTEYDGSGIDEAKADAESLKEIAGSFEQAGSSIGEAMSGMVEQFAGGTQVSEDFGTALAGLEKPAGAGTLAISQFAESLQRGQASIGDIQGAFEELQTPMERTVITLQAVPGATDMIAQRAESLNKQLSPVAENFAQIQDALSQSVPLLPQFAENLHVPDSNFDNSGLRDFNENYQVFQEALSTPDPFQMVQDHLKSTGQVWGDFYSAIGEDNFSVLRSAAAFQKDAFASGGSFLYNLNQRDDVVSYLNTLDGSYRTTTNSLNNFQTTGKSIAETMDWNKIGPPTDWSKGVDQASDSVTNLGSALMNEFGGVGGGEYGPFPASPINAFGGVGNYPYGPSFSANPWINEYGGVGSSEYAPYTANPLINEFGGAGNYLYGPLTKSAAAINEFGGVGSFQYGPDISPTKTISGALGDVFSGGLQALESLARPLFTLQMLGTMIGSVGQGMYDMAVIAEGPAAHSVGTFTGTIDSLGESMKQTAGQFSEGLGQGFMPTLNAMNSQLSQPGGAGGFGQFLGGLGSGIASLWQIGTGTNLGGGLEGIVNQVAQWFGMNQPFQGPPPQNAVAEYIKTTQAAMPQTIQMQIAQSSMQSEQLLDELNNPDYLAAQQRATVIQQMMQKAQATYDTKHPLNPAQIEADYQYQQYVDQQNKAYESQPTYGQMIQSDIGAGNWGAAFGTAGTAIANSPLGAIIGGIGNFFAGIPNAMVAWNQPVFDPNAPSHFTFQCFPAGTRVLLADGREQAIDTLRVGQEVFAYDGTRHVAAPIVALIKPPPKPVFQLVLSSGNTLTLTDSHPVSTTRGWQALSVEHAKQANPDLEIGVLKVGSRIHTMTGIVTLLAIHALPGAVQVYNITVAAPHTFYASGVLVHNKAQGGGGGGGTDLGSQIADMVGTIQLPHIDLSGIQSSLAGAFSGIQLPHLDLSGFLSGLAGSFSGIQLPHIDLSGISSELSNIFSGIHLPSLPDIAGDINGMVGNLFSGIHLPSLPDIAGNINNMVGNLFSGIHLPSLPDIAGDFNSLVSGIFSGWKLPSPPDIVGELNKDLGGLFSGIKMPQMPDIAGQINSMLGGMLSGIQIPRFSFPGYATGIIDSPSTHIAMVGESGPELMIVPQGASILPGASLMSGGGGISLQGLLGDTGNSSSGMLQPIQIMLDGRVLAQVIVPLIPTMTRQYGGAQR